MAKSYKAFQVGDALFSVFTAQSSEDGIEKSIFDIGYSRADLFDAVNRNEFIESKTMVISHFHRDHFQGLERLANSTLNIEKVIIPKLPFNEVVSDGIIAYVTIQLYYLARLNGFYETDILNIIARKNKCDFSVERKVRGDVFNASETEFKVLWPDPDYVSGILVIQRALEDIEGIAKENTEFKRFYEAVIKSNTFNSDVLEVGPAETVPEDFNVILTEEQLISLQRANRRLRNKANEVCLAFDDCEKFFLSLGDMENGALRELFHRDFNTSSQYSVVLSAHHGSHSTDHPNWQNVEACVVLHSNGNRMKKFYKEDYLKWSNYYHHTHDDGQFNSELYTRDCLLNEITTD